MMEADALMSENHIRGISVTLSLLDKALCEFDHWACGNEIRSVLYEVRNTLSPAQRRLIASEVAGMKATLHEIRAELGLEASVHSVEKMIVGSCSILWTSLVELEGPRLRRYGEVAPGVTEYLDPRIASLNDGLRRISALVAGPQPP